MKIWIYPILAQFVLLSSCSTSKREYSHPDDWAGLPELVLDYHPYFGLLGFTTKTSQEGKLVERKYLKATKFQTKAYCRSLGGCMGMSSVPTCDYVFEIREGVITSSKMKDTKDCPYVPPHLLPK